MATSLFFWDAGSAYFPATNAPAVAYTAGTNFPWLSLNFDQSTDETVYFFGTMPQAYSGDCTVEIWWTAAVTGNVVWAAQFLGLVNDEVLDAAMSSAATVTDGVTAAADIMQATITLTSPALVAGDFLVLKIYRDADNGSDTAAGDAKLLGVELRQA